MATIGFRGALPSPDDATSIVCGSKAIGIGACEDCSALDRLECLENLQKISSLLFIFSTQSREPSHPLRVSASWYFLSFARVQEEGATLFPGTVVPPQLFGEPGESTTEANRATNGKTANLLVLPSLSFFRQGCGGELPPAFLSLFLSAGLHVSQAAVVLPPRTLARTGLRHLQRAGEKVRVSFFRQG